MHYAAIDATQEGLLFALQNAKEQGARSVSIEEDDLLREGSFAGALDAIEQFPFMRVKLRASGALLSDYAAAAEMVRRGISVFEMEFFGATPQEHDKVRGRGSFSLLAMAAQEIYTAALDHDRQIVLQFSLRFSENLSAGVLQLCDLMPSRIRLCDRAPLGEIRAAATAAMARGIVFDISPELSECGKSSERA